MSNLRVSIVGGCGHVGLPLGIILAEKGFLTSLFDIDENKVNLVNQGQLPFLEEQGSERLSAVLDKQNLLATTDKKSLLDSDVIIFTLWTPLDEYDNAKIHELTHVLDDFLPFLEEKHTIIFRSTLYPGTSRILFEYLKIKGKKCSLAYCPERIAQGKSLIEMSQFPQIVSAYDNRALEVSALLFSSITQKEVIVLEPLEAELAKLFCNAWRYINFAISNQFYQIAENAGANFGKIYQAVKLDYPRMKDFAPAGFTAGPCLFKDTMQLASFGQNHFFLGHNAMLINEGMPAVVLEKLKKEIGQNLRGKNIGLLGMTFKANNDDIRESLSFKLKKLLELQGCKVYCHDPYLKEEDFLLIEFFSLDQMDKLDAVILSTPHDLYQKIEIPVQLTYINIWCNQ